ncbi:hypothetical protein OA45_01123 [Bacillus sp. UMTAT18]|nr:hypothetical protein OA45_01123 [Bacillus sp. UMTAT18]
MNELMLEIEELETVKLSVEESSSTSFGCGGMF